MDIKEYFDKNQINEILSFKQDFAVTNLGIGERGFFASLFDGQTIILTSDFVSANTIRLQLESLGKVAKVVSGGYDSPIFVYSQDLSQIKNLLRCVCEFKNKTVDILIVVANALFQKLPKDLKSTHFEIGKNYEFSYLSKLLSNYGYRKVDMVGSEGEYSIRGDIVDIFNLGDQMPTRLSFFDDQLEEIYNFSFEELNKKQNLEKFVLFPCTLFFDTDQDALFENIKNVDTQNVVNKNKLAEVKEQVVQEVIRQPNNLKLAWNFVFEQTQSFLQTLDCDRVIFNEPQTLIQTINLVDSSNKNTLFNLYENGLVGKIHLNFFANKNDVLKTAGQKIAFENLMGTPLFEPKQTFDFRTFPSKKYVFDYNALVSDLNLLRNANDIILFAGDQSTKTNLSNYLIGRGISLSDQNAKSFDKHTIKITEDYLYQSVLVDGYPLLVATSDLVKKNKSAAKKGKASLFLPKVGDFVVHNFHGIGKCKEIRRIKIGNIERDYFVIEYQKGDILYLPTEQTDSLSAYVGGEENPTLNKLGGLEFAKLKAKAKAGIKELAFDLLKLYSERSQIKGFKFAEDDSIQQAFEDCFEYEETPDQLCAINDIKSDMTSGKIMDRLVCGDVGFGKTEVAFRAIFKAILSGKQVALLCPTTILAEQHYKNAKKRFADFMVNVKVINRLVPKNVQNQIVKEVAEGKVDLLIGTHRLLSNDIKFKDLGLLVLDEEQRFGVEAKEKLKNLKNDISVLTLSATPIPRTLHMSLTGIRDISLIETAPKNRLPVQSFVCEYDENVIKDACMKEINRGGQVFIVYNRVETIYDFANKIQALLPDVKIGVAHGQMSAKTLEDAVLKLYNGEFQILIATSLIENGIDIPQANTLIVVDSDKLGLSSLYQLKGRIGRSNILAYAYFMYKPDKILTEDALKRLQAISEFSSMGSGFKIALRDLEIRGAGSVLGSKQHGHIEKIGYDLYSKMLDDTIKELEGKQKQEQKEVKIDIKLNSFVPQEYIFEENERIRVYNDISGLLDTSQAKNYLQKLEQTYGDVPNEVDNLCKIAVIKNLAQQNNVARVIINEQTARLYIYKDENILCPHLHQKLEECKQDFVLKFESLPIIELVNTQANINAKVEKIIELLS